jgi:glucose-6-phosphate isomerase
MQPLEIFQDFQTGKIAGQSVKEIKRTLADLTGVFRDEEAYKRLDPATVVYKVQLYQPIEEGVEGGLFWGSTVLEPGMVGDEFFLTKGHFHAVINRGEYYVTVAGIGALVLMTEEREIRLENMVPGSVHYIPGRTAHRVANTGDSQLTFLACWPSDAGHDYSTIERDGFSGRVVKVDGHPRLVATQ